MPECELVSSAYPVQCYRRSTTPGIQGEDAVPFHRHDGFEFYLFLNGTVNFYAGDSVYSPVRGELFIISPDRAHRCINRGAQPYERFIINLRKDKILNISEEVSLSAIFTGSSSKFSRGPSSAPLSA